MKRWGVMTLVALLVLGTMGAALADDTVETETETAKEPLLPDSYAPDLAWAEVDLEWVDGLVQFVLHWGYDDEVLGTDDGPECRPPDSEDPPSTFGFGGLPLVPEVRDCVFLDVEKNDHYNHGSMVSSVVHWLKALKDGSLPDLMTANPELQKLLDMPKGQVVKLFAQNDFGKGNFELPSEAGPAAADVESVEADVSDGHGPPQWVKDKKADKSAKGKNK
jgi:hypothetical protein